MSHVLDPAAEEVILLSETGEAIGTADKATIHGADTPLHLAFSCHVLNSRGEFLMTRRSLNKLTWPGVWTNSFCGHPSPSEKPVDAVMRRAQHELGMSVTDLEVALPEFRYRAVDASGVVENEICPVYTATSDQTPAPNPSEVMDVAWVDPADLGRAIRLTPWAFSPWLVLQAVQLPHLGGVRP